MHILRATLVAALFVSLFSCAHNAPTVAHETPTSAILTTTVPIKVSPADSVSAEPAMAASPDGGGYLVYVEHHGDAGSDVFLQAVDEKGTPKNERVRINNAPDSAKAWKGDPPTIVVSADKTIFVGWTRKIEDPHAKGNDLVLSVSRDGGRSFAAPAKVNDDTKPASHGMHSLAVDGQGRVVMAWLDERNVQTKPHEMNTSGMMHHEETEPNSEVFSAVSEDGGKTFSANQKLASEVCPCCKTVLLSAADGTVYVSWRQVLVGDHRHIAVASSKDGGRSFSQGVVVSNDNWQLSACPVSGAALASAEKNEVEVVWYTEGAAGPAGLYYSSSHDGGKTFSERTLLSDAAASGTPVLANGACIFNTRDGGVKMLTLGDHGQTLASADIAQASVPATAAAGGKLIVAFTRATPNATGVWAASVEVNAEHGRG